MARRVKEKDIPPSEALLRSRIEKWMWNSDAFIQEAILDPRSTPERPLKLSTQQKQACKELNNIVRAKSKLGRGEKLDKITREYAEKLGITIMSAKGTGKDAWTSWIIIWFLVFFEEALIPCTAPTDHQLKDVLWAEIARWLRPSLMNELVTWQATKIFNIKGEGRSWFAIPRTANLKASSEEQALTLQGFHSRNMMLVVDEASGVPDPVFEAFDSTMTEPNNFAILIFNPNRSTGYALKTHTQNRGKWICLHWSALDSELVTPESIAQKRDMYGEESNYYRVNVLGLPPTADSDSLVPWDWIIDARGREIEPLKEDYLIKACDFGAGGDKSIIVTRKGGCVYPFAQNVTKDSNDLTDWVHGDYVRDEADILLGDNVGIGWAVMGNLRQRIGGGKVRSVDSRNKAKRDDRFHNKRSEMYWNLRTAFENKEISLSKLPEHQYDEIMGQLSATKYKEETGRVQIIKKANIKDVIGHSPDEADALAISYALPAYTLRKPSSRNDDPDYDYDEDFAVCATSRGWMGA